MPAGMANLRDIGLCADKFGPIGQGHNDPKTGHNRNEKGAVVCQISLRFGSGSQNNNRPRDARNRC